MISVKNVSVIFGKGTPLESCLFKNLHLDIQPGDFVTVIGGNGAGKSTLMNILSGDILVDRGSITLDNVDITRWLPHERAGLISRVFQDPLLGSYADLSIEENLSLAFSRGKKRSLENSLQPKIRKYFQERIRSLVIF